MKLEEAVIKFIDKTEVYKHNYFNLIQHVTKSEVLCYRDVTLLTDHFHTEHSDEM